MITTRSPGRIDSLPRGTIIRSPRMMLATLDSAGIAASRNADDHDETLESSGLDDVELHHLNLAVREDVGLPCGGKTDGARDRMRGLELGGDHEVDIDLRVPARPR